MLTKYCSHRTEISNKDIVTDGYLAEGAALAHENAPHRRNTDDLFGGGSIEVRRHDAIDETTKSMSRDKSIVATIGPFDEGPTSNRGEGRYPRTLLILWLEHFVTCCKRCFFFFVGFRYSTGATDTKVCGQGSFSLGGISR